MTTITFQLEKLTCPSCMQKIIDNKISEEEILHKIEEIGYSAKKI